MIKQSIYLLLLFASILQGNGSNSAAIFLKLDPSPISSGLGKAKSTYPQNPYSVIHNPALLGNINTTQLALSFNNYYNLINQSYIGIQHPITNHLKIGASLTKVHVPGIIESNDKGDILGKVKNTYQSITIVNSLHLKSLDTLFKTTFFKKNYIGLKINQIYIDLHNNNASSTLFDIGFFTKLNKKSWIGFYQENITKSKLKWNTKNTIKEKILNSFVIGYTFRILPQLSSFSEWCFEKISPTKKRINYHQGFEWRPIKNRKYTLFLRGGLNKKESKTEYSLGTGILIKNIKIDYSYTFSTETYFEPTHKASINMILKPLKI